MSASVLEVIGALAACGGTGAALVLRHPRHRYAAMGAGLAAAVLLIAGQVWDESRFDSITSQPGALALAAVLGGTALGATAATFQRVPAAFAIAVFAVMALRIPIGIGDETSFLLIPLYGVIAGGFLRGAWLCLSRRDSELRTESSPSADEPPAVRWLSAALAASLVVYAVGIAWSDDPANAVRTVAFFLAPFAAMFTLLRDVRWYRKLAGQALLAFAIVAVVFAAIALYQWGARDLLLNKELKDANELHLYFRVNSLFRDPNVLGRYLALAIVGIAAWVAWGRPRLQVLVGLAAIVPLMLALGFTYSQTSFAALVVGLGVLVWLRFGRLGLAAAVASAIVALAVVIVIGGPSRDESVDTGRDDLAEQSSGRTDLISGGLELFVDAPIAGQGSGSFANAYRREVEKVKKPVSHTEPITVAAEQGVIGLIPYGAVILFSGLALFRPWPARSSARAGVGAAYVVLLVHSIGYAGFAIDPATWALLALGVALRE